jgi:small subunit ribosomal protein S21
MTIMMINRKTRTGVIIKETDNINQALRKFKKKVEESGKLEDLRAKEYYEKPTTERKRAKGAAKARLKKKLQKEALPKKR